jgi:hypothetical protein
MTEATAITTVEELPAELREELVGKRKAGTTLAELKKAFPQVAPDVIRAVLPPLPKGTETKPEAPAKPARTRRAKTAPATDAQAQAHTHQRGQRADCQLGDAGAQHGQGIQRRRG